MKKNFFFFLLRKIGGFYVIITSFDRFLMFLAKTTKTIHCKFTFYSGFLHQCTTILNLFLNAFNDNLYRQERTFHHYRKFSWEGLWGSQSMQVIHTQGVFIAIIYSVMLHL